MLASTPSCPSLCEFLSTGEYPSRFRVLVFWIPFLVPRVPEKYTVSSAQSSAYAGKVDYNMVSPGSLRRSFEAPYTFFYPGTIQWVDHIPYGSLPTEDLSRVPQLGFPLGWMDDPLLSLASRLQAL